MASGFPDWTRAIVLLGWDGTNFIPVLLDEDGNLNVLLRGEDAGGDLHMVRVDDNGQIISVMRGSSGNYLDVDALGYMTTVIKANYEGDLTTVACDDTGRLSAFIVDQSDAWGRFLSVGNAELAARLGSLVNYDRRGQLMFASGFECGWGHWTASGSGTGNAQELSPVYYRSGGYSAKLTAGSTLSHYATLSAEVGGYPTGKIGVEFSFSISGLTDLIEIYWQYYDGTSAHQARVRYDHTNSKLYLRDDTGAYTEVGDLSLITGRPYLFNKLKIVGDPATDLYTRLLINDEEIDVSAVTLYHFASAYSARVVIYIKNDGRAANNDTVYVDDVVLTSTEPE